MIVMNRWTDVQETYSSLICVLAVRHNLISRSAKLNKL